MTSSAARTREEYKIAVILGDGIGPEVVSAGVTVLQALAKALKLPSLTFTHLDWSSETYKQRGQYFPDGGLEQLKAHDAILFGAVGAPGQYCKVYELHFECAMC